MVANFNVAEILGAKIDLENQIDMVLMTLLESFTVVWAVVVEEVF